MDAAQENNEAQVAEQTEKLGSEVKQAPPLPVDDGRADAVAAKKMQRTKRSKKTTRLKKRTQEESSDCESDADSRDSESEDNSEDEKRKRKRKQKQKRATKLAEKKTKHKKKSRGKKNKSKKSESDSYNSSSDEDTSSESESESEYEDKKSRRTARKLKAKTKKGKKHFTPSDYSTSDSSFSSMSEESSSEDERTRRKRAKSRARRKSKKAEKSNSTSSSESSGEEDTPVSYIDAPAEPPVPADDIDTQVAKMTNLLASLKMAQSGTSAIASATKLEKPVKKNALEFKRVDQVYDIKIRDWKLVESNKVAKDDFDCVFTVRRRLNWEGKYQETQVDIKSKVLRNCLQEVFKECKSISLVEDTPQVDPHTLFHYYNEIKSYVKKELKPKLKKARKAREKKLRTQQVAQCKLLLKYLDEDYTSVRKALKPMLKAGTITYDLVWALFKPNTIAFTPTYGNKDDPRCFRVDFSYEYESWLTQAKSLVVDGRYLEYDGKAFGLGDHQVQIQAFKGHKKITSLSAYPLKYHKDPDGIKKQLVQRGMKFVALQGMNYRLQKGIAYMKVKNSVVRFNINGRVMIDPAIFRRINPNYQLSYIKHDELDQDEAEDDEDDSDDCCCSGSDEDSDKDQDKLRTVMWKDRKGKKWPIKLPQSVIDKEAGANSDAKMEGGEDETDNKRHVFTEEELLIASPVVLGFAFSEKYWLEFSLSGIDEINWNDEAFDSLVLGDRIKQNLKGLVSSHRFNAAKTIDDVIQGKGKGLNVVLHGPPGVGKTLTGESIAEYLKCPLYAVSAGELGTNSRSLEQDLNRIMDITHSWGAILLLDEADVFLEARQPHDIHRNSLVSVFLRLTEYYQGILFLTTNRVETFDEAFQSRIHMGIRYENLQPKARKKIWQHHVGKVEKMAEMAKGKDEGKVKPFTESDFDELSKRNMNGRQIKNTVKTSQSIALAEKAVFGMEHVKRVLEVAEAFEDDMRGGKGYRDAMRHYT
ncbi:hypothetical protein BKA63DRAFT_534997 [Paraphoma chrysanthemicola]|nr:hypothetical protein BKA63DRAFT_534997 [Paraphoma chrysanthemicola]